MKNDIPILGKTYNHYDDGIINEIHKYDSTITEIIPFDEIDEDIFFLWEAELKESNNLYNTKTDYFIKANLKINDTVTIETIYVKIIYVRDQFDGWFSLGFWAGRLDIDGQLTELIDLNNKERFMKLVEQQNNKNI